MSPPEEVETRLPGTMDGAGGIAAEEPDVELLPLLVSPAFNNKGKNTIRMELIPVACWKLNDARFAFGSSFVLPETREEFQVLLELRSLHPGAPLSVFGHADPVGDDVFNKRLSGHRAESIYAVLIHDAARWETLYSTAGPAEGWGISSIQHMLAALGFAPGPPTGSMNPPTRAAVEQFQTGAGLTVDGSPGPKTRAKLFAAYMAFLCPEVLSKTEFLGRGADAKGKADFQGCSEFNPLMIFSAAESKEFEKPQNKSERDAENVVNRRILILLFRPGTTVPPEKWPCPRVAEGVEGCRVRFWSDAEQRRAPQEGRREFGQSRDTFACRFYHRLAGESSCELGRHAGDCFVFLKLFDDRFETVLKNQDYELRGLASGRAIRGRTAGDGIVRHERLPDDHYALFCAGHTENVEVYYMEEMERHNDLPWFMRVRGFEAAPAQAQ